MRFTFLILLLPLILSACKRDPIICVYEPIDETAIYLVEQKLKNHFVFKPGSWWVYKEKNTGITDSVYVDSMIASWRVGINSCMERDGNVPEDTVSLEEEINTFITSTHYQRSFQNMVDARNQVFLNLKYLKIYDFFMLKDGADNPFTDIQELDTIYSGAYIFTNVLKVTKERSVIYLEPDAQGYYQPSDTMSYYFAPNAGLVKRENLSESEVWELVNYNVQQ